MCLAIPGKVIETFEVDGMKTAKVSFGGMVKQVCLEYTRKRYPAITCSCTWGSR
jgi:hydrogenase maturation factor